MVDTDDTQAVPETEYEATGEDNVDEVELTDMEATSGDKLKDLRTKLKTCEEDKRTHLEELQRTKADFLNSRKRLEEQQTVMIERAIASQIEDLLPLVDSFQMAMANQATWEAVDKNWRNGIEGIYNQLQSILKNHNVTQIEAVGQAFDPNLHEAVSSTESDQDSDTVVEVIQQGFMRNDTVIRPAKVIISN